MENYIQIGDGIDAIIRELMADIWNHYGSGKVRRIKAGVLRK